MFWGAVALLSAVMSKRVGIVLLGGWLLMLAPIDKHSGTARFDAPITQWEQAEAFDTAKACEDAHNKYYVEAIKAQSSIPAKDRSPADQVEPDRLRRGLCVPPSAVYPRRE